MDEYGYPDPVMYDVTCTTEGCENFGIALRVPADPVNPLIACGPCGQWLTATLTPETAPEPPEAPGAPA